MIYDSIIIGGGAAGLMAAVTAAGRGNQILVLEKRNKAAKKLAMTGNGRCNLTNLKQHPDFYHSQNQDFPLPVLDHFASAQVISFFSGLGIFTKNRDGYIYPHTEEASVVGEILEARLRRLGGKLKCSSPVSRIEKKDGLFLVTVDDWQYQSKTVIIATGSYAGLPDAEELGDTAGTWNSLAKGLGHRNIDPLPSLVPLLSKDKLLPRIGTLRLDGACTLRIDGANLDTQRGNLQFTGKGISGIPVFQLSAAAVRALATGSEVVLSVNLMPDFEQDILMQYLQNRWEADDSKTAAEMLLGLIPKKMILPLLERAGVQVDLCCTQVTQDEYRKIATTILDFTFIVSGHAPAVQAQVLQGGIDTREVMPMTLESRLQAGLFFAGEALDVDAVCGGYNLHWAWASGYVAGHLGSLQDTLYPLDDLSIEESGEKND